MDKSSQKSLASGALARATQPDTVAVRRKNGKQIVYDFKTGRANRQRRTDAELIDAMSRADGLRRPDLDLAGLYGAPEDRW